MSPKMLSILPALLLALFMPSGSPAQLELRGPDHTGAQDARYVRYQLPTWVTQKPFRFAEELIPVDRPDVRRRIVSQINFLLLDARSVLVEWLTEKNRYTWIFDEVFQKQGVPKDFAYFSPVLSGLTRNGLKSAGVGVWVLEKPCTVVEGVEMHDDKWRDDRMDLEISTRCFASKITATRKDLNGTSWLLAAAAYVTSTKIVQDLQQKWSTQSFWDIPLPPSAEQLVVRWIAFRIISSSPSAFGLRFEPQPPFVFDQLTGLVLSKDLQLAEIARMTATPPREILLINPKVKPSAPIFPAVVDGKKVIHSISAPKGKGKALLDDLRKAGYLSLQPIK